MCNETDKYLTLWECQEPYCKDTKIITIFQIQIVIISGNNGSGGPISGERMPAVWICRRKSVILRITFSVFLPLAGVGWRGP